MKTRLIAGLSGLAVLLPAVIYGGPIAVELIVLVALGICSWEYARMALPDDRVDGIWLTGGIYGWYLVSLHRPQWNETFFALWVPATLILVTLRPGADLRRAADRMGRHLLGVAWILLLTMLVRLRALPDGLGWVIFALGIGWFSDTGAYFAGRSFGRRKLYARISPKKTVEGMVGGVLTAILGLAFLDRLLAPDLHLVDILVLGGLGSVAGVLGDLAESLLKRACGVKDAGAILPGHGGLLDRIDSVLFVGAFVYGYATFVMA